MRARTSSRRFAETLGGMLAAWLILGAGTLCAEPQLVATVSWTAPGGHVGTVLFQGSGENGALRGIAYAGKLQLPVIGTIGDDGTVSGTLTFDDGKTVNIVGSFSATIDASQQLHGAYVIFSTAGSWTAPADNVPVPAETGGQS